MRTCGIEGCDKPHRARGLCSTHYNLAHQPDRHPVVEVPCAYCGTMVAKDKGRDKRYANVFCDYTCRDLMRLEVGWPGDGQGARRSVLPADHWARWYGRSTPLDFRSCEWCGSWVVNTPMGTARRYCRTGCKSKARHAYRRGGYVRDYTRAAVFERDNWTCHICGDPIDPTLPGSELGGATIDHVIARARGGLDVEANVKAAHRYCNSVKRDLDLADVA